MSTFNDICKIFRQQKSAIESKGGIVVVGNTNPSPNEILSGIQSIPTGTQIISSSGYSIITAELPNRTIKLYNSNDDLLSSKTTNTTYGGTVNFTVSTTGVYKLKAFDNSNNELWTNTVNITEIGVYNVKSGLALNNYEWDEINWAGYYGYAKYMFKFWDFKYLPSFMGSTNQSYTRAHIIGFDHDDKVTGGKAPITFMLERTSSSYKHWNTGATNDNGISWLGSLIRANCMKNGEVRYVYDKSVTSSTSGTYYVYNDTTNEFDSVTLPDEFTTTVKYYTKETLAADGAFIAGMPSTIQQFMVQVKKKTWGGYGAGISYSTDTTIFETNDWMFIPADCEIFGNTNRYSTYSKYALEGEQYGAFKEYAENRLRFGNYRWLRSPTYSYSTNFCCWYNTGYVEYTNANYTYYCPLCFCIGAQPQS